MHFSSAQLTALVALAIPTMALPLGPSASLLLPGPRGSAFEIFKRQPVQQEPESYSLPTAPKGSKPHQAPESKSHPLPQPENVLPRPEGPEISKREPAEEQS